MSFWGRVRGKGTLLNTLAVVVGSLLGLGAGAAVPAEWQGVAIFGIGLCTVGIGVSMFLKSRNVLAVVGAVVVGGVLGAALGIDRGLAGLAEWARASLGAGGGFNEGLVTASVLFCVGPMTLLGCLEDGLEGKTELLGVKSLLDGVASVFLAAGLGVGVLASAGVVLVFQGILTLLAGRLEGFARRGDLLDETVATGGVVMMAIGLGLSGIRDFPAELFLPSLVVAPVLAWVWGKFRGVKGAGDRTGSVG